MKHFHFILFFFTSQFIYAQQDVFNEELQKQQRATVQEAILALENGEINQAMNYFDPSIPKLKKDLKSISKETQKLKATTKLSIVIIYEKGFNIFRCRYYNDKGEYYLLDLHLEEDNAGSTIKKFVIKGAAELKEKKELREQNNTIPPPPPPPPTR